MHNLIIHHLPLPNYRRKLFFLIKALTFCNLFHVEQIVRKLKVDTPINLDSEFRNIDACIGRKKHVLHHKNRIFNSLNFIENQVIANLFLPHKGQIERHLAVANGGFDFNGNHTRVHEFRTVHF